jgi:hypothetical protein
MQTIEAAISANEPRGVANPGEMFEPLGEVTISGLVDPMLLCRWRPLARS